MRAKRRAALACLAVAAALLVASGVAWAATLNGTNGNDTIDGTTDADAIKGYDGADTIQGMGGGDTIEGNSGADKLYGADEAGTVQDSDNTISGGIGNDIVVGGQGADNLGGNEGQDTIDGKNGADTIGGGWGEDTIDGGEGADTINGGNDNDILRAGPLEETDPDTVMGEEGNDTIYAANFPASKDKVLCGAGTDKVTVDSLDEVSDNCEKVKKIQEEEPNLADGTYQLVPDPTSECNLGEGTFTVGNDPETGERGVEVDLGGPEGQARTPQDGAQACTVDINFQQPVTAQGENITQSSNARSYKGEKPPQQEIDKVVQAADSATDEPASSANPSSGEVTAQYAWNLNKYNHVMKTWDPANLELNRTWHTLTWWHNGYDTDYYSFSRSCRGWFTGITWWHNSYYVVAQ